MADEKTAQPDKVEDPFKDFQSEEYDRGEPIVAAPVKEEEQPTGEGEEPPPTKESEPQPVAKEGEQPQAAAEGEQPPPVKEGEQPPKKKSVQERINEVTRARREAERREEAANARVRELEARLAAPPLKKEEPPKKETAAAAVEEDPNAPKPEAYEFGELDSRYIRALASYEADKRFTELRAQDEQIRQTRETEARQAAARDKFETMIENGSKVHEDFYEKVVIGSESGVWPLSAELGELILASDVGNAIAYHLATNPKEADQVYRSSPLEQARYFGRMEAKFSAGQAAASGDGTGKPAPKIPKAPAPPDTARGAGGQFHATADTDDFAAFEQRATKGS